MTEDTKNNAVEAQESESPASTDPATTDSAVEKNSEETAAEASAAEESTDPLAEAQAEAAQLKEKLLRMAADFDNYRKRSRREVGEAEKKGRDGLLNDLLPVFDNLERATSHAESTDAAEDANKIKGLVDGITLVMKQFRDSLGRLGIERVESVGQPFDPAVHEAIQHLETADVPPGCIAAEVQPGYRQGERLVRPAMVVVAKAPQNADPVGDGEEESAGGPDSGQTPASFGNPTDNTGDSQSADGESPEA